MSAELAARKTAAAAALADYIREINGQGHLTTYDYMVWAGILAEHLRLVLEQLGMETGR